MKITKLQIKNLLGLRESELYGGSYELTGGNGVGKSTVIDAIRYGLTNKSQRPIMIRQGENEGEILIETDTGLTINRKARSDRADYKAIQQNGKAVTAPEGILGEIFTPLQLNPVEFLSWDEKTQNRAILDAIEYAWDLDTIRGWFGEIPPGVNYGGSILDVLYQIQSKEGYYYQTRWELNRQIRDKRANLEEIGAAIPTKFDVKRWEDYSLSDTYTAIERIRKHNQQIEQARQVIEQRDAKIRSFQAEKEIQLAALDREAAAIRIETEKEIERLKGELEKAHGKLARIEERKQERILTIEAEYKANTARYDAEVESYQETAKHDPMDSSELQAQAQQAEQMKSYINEYRRMERLEEERIKLQQESDALTAKIELARRLPGQILEESTIPVKDLTVQDGIPLIRGLPVGNLSDGQKLMLCVDIATAKPGNLQILLLDEISRLSDKNREALYQACKAKGLPFIATRTTNDDELIITEL